MRSHTSCFVGLPFTGLFCLTFAAAGVACGPSDFDPASLIESVRILASRSDKPYAPPGATIHSQVLAVDARPDASTNEPMVVYWLPFVCVNPPNDAYYACFSPFEANPGNVAQAGLGVDGGGPATITSAISVWDGGAEAGVSGSGLGSLPSSALRSLPTGVDISQYLIKGARAQFQLPSDIVTSHRPAKGTTPYGLAVVFNIACAGHIEILPLDPSNPNPEQIPIGCFNAEHAQLTANDYVLGYTEVFAYDSLTNANPIISSFSFRDASVPLDAAAEAGVTFPYCPAGTKKCPDNIAVLGVPDASWERDPQNPGGPDGGPLGEQIWVDYYTTMGTLSDDAILVFDPTEGRVAAPHPENIQGITAKQRGTLWAVLHDNRGGADWITVTLNAN
jgi:hypothetical protein